MGTNVVINQAALDRLLKGKDGPVYKDLANKVRIVQAGAKTRCPVRTGALQASIYGEIRMESKGPVGYVGSELEYAIYVEEGTRYMEPFYFLEGALDDIRGM